MANLRYLKIVDGSVIKQIDNLEKEYPHTCFPQGGPNSTWISEQNLTLITEGDISDARDKVENVTPYQSGGKWYTDKLDAWKTYRQALRDVTKQSDPDKITWPSEPS